MPLVLPLCGYWSKASGFCSPISKPRDVPRGLCSLFPREDASARGGASCSPPQPDGPAKSLGVGRLTSPRAGAVNKSREERLILWARSLAQFFFCSSSRPAPIPHFPTSTDWGLAALEKWTLRGSKALKQVLGCTRGRAGLCQRIFVLGRAPAAPWCVQPSGQTQPAAPCTLSKVSELLLQLLTHLRLQAAPGQRC